MLKIWSVLFVVLFGLPLTVQAVGLSVSPSSLDDFSKEISLEPAEFNLSPQEIALVNISADFNHLSAGVRKTNISVLSQALDKKSFNAISGIKVPVSIYVTESYFKWSGPAVFVVVFLGLGVIFMLWYLLVYIFRLKPKKNKLAGFNFLLHHKRKKWYKW